MNAILMGIITVVSRKRAHPRMSVHPPVLPRVSVEFYLKERPHSVHVSIANGIFPTVCQASGCVDTKANVNGKRVSGHRPHAV